MPTSAPDQFFNPLNPDHVSDPDDLMQRSRVGCPVGKVSDVLYTVNTDSGTRQAFDDTKHLSNKGNFSVAAEDVRWPFTPVTNTDPPGHTALRARLLKDFAPARLRKLTPRVVEIVQKCVSALPESGYIDLYAEYAHFIPARILYTLIGIPDSMWNDVQQWADVIVATVPEPTEKLPEFASIAGYLGRLAAERRANPGRRHDDAMDNLCFANDGDTEMSIPEIVTHILQLVVASTDTTRALIANCLYRLLEDRRHWEAVLDDRALLATAVEESLRLDSPAQFMVRSVVEDVTISSCPISPGHKVYLNIQSANHDEERWGGDSRQYRLDRPNASAHLAFGRGVHACIGAPLARIEASVAIGALLDRFPEMKLAPGADFVKCPGPLVRRIARVPVLLTGEAAR